MSRSTVFNPEIHSSGARDASAAITMTYRTRANSDESSTDADLVARAQRGEEGAFATLFQAHKRRVYSLCLRITGSPTEAEDLTQEAFLKLFRGISTFRGDEAFSTCVRRLVLYEVLMHPRKKRTCEVPAPDADSSQTAVKGGVCTR